MILLTLILTGEQLDVSGVILKMCLCHEGMEISTIYRVLDKIWVNRIIFLTQAKIWIWTATMAIFWILGHKWSWSRWRVKHGLEPYCLEFGTQEYPILLCFQFLGSKFCKIAQKWGKRIKNCPKLPKIWSF